MTKTHQLVIAQQDHTKKMTSHVLLVDTNVKNVKTLPSTVQFVLESDMVFQTVNVHLILMKMKMESVKNVQYNVLNVKVLPTNVNHVQLTEFQDLNHIVLAQMDNSKHLLENVTIVHSDAIPVMETIAHAWNVLMKQES